MKPREILFVITKATYGGAQKYLYDLAAHLPRDEFHTSLAYGVHGRLADNMREAGASLYRLPSLGRDIAFVSDIRSFFQLLSVIRAIRPDVVHLNSSKAAGIGALAARLCGVGNIVFTVHGWPFKEDRNPVARGIIYLISWWSAFLSTKVIVVSKTDEALGKKMFLCGHKIVYIPLGIEPPPFLSRVDASAEFKLDDASFPRIVSNAELTRNKGIRFALEAVSILKKRGVNVSYSIIGDGEERQALERLARELDITERVKLLGFVPQAVRYLKAFDLFLLPSIKEGMPYVLLEAAAANLPVVTTDVVDPAFLGSYENVRVVPPSNPEALASAILETIKAQEENPLFAAPKNDSFTEMLKRTIALYYMR